MKNTFGNSLTLTLVGESHGDFIGAVIDGISPGVKISHDAIKAALEKRRPKGKASTSRVEADEYKIISGEYNGYTTGTPLTIIIPTTLTAINWLSLRLNAPLWNIWIGITGRTIKSGERSWTMSA